MIKEFYVQALDPKETLDIIDIIIRDLNMELIFDIEDRNNEKIGTENFQDLKRWYIEEGEALENKKQKLFIECNEDDDLFQERLIENNLDNVKNYSCINNKVDIYFTLGMGSIKLFNISDYRKLDKIFEYLKKLKEFDVYNIRTKFEYTNDVNFSYLYKIYEEIASNINNYLCYTERNKPNKGEYLNINIDDLSNIINSSDNYYEHYIKKKNIKIVPKFKNEIILHLQTNEMIYLNLRAINNKNTDNGFKRISLERVVDIFPKEIIKWDK